MKTFDNLWPLPPPETTIVTGPYGCGKSTFTLGTGATPERTLVVDFEKSQSAFAKQLPELTYVDMQAIMAEKYPKGYKMIDLFYVTIAQIDEKLQPGQFDVLVLDNASPLEDAIVAYVEKNPMEFGHTPGQYNAMSGLKWGDVKTKYAQLLTRWGSVAKMIFIVVHLRDKWVGNTIQKDAYGKPVQEPKGKETLDQLSSMFVWLEHGPKGVPSGKILKCRVDRKVFVADPENPPADVPADYLVELNNEPGIVSIPVLPLRLPKATWPAIRNYMRHPADLMNPAPGETLTEQEMTADDRLKLRAIISHNESEIANVERMKMEAVKPQPTVNVSSTPPQEKQESIPAPTPKPEQPAPAVTLDMLVELYGAEAIMANNEGKIPGTQEELDNLVLKLAGAQ